MEGKVGGRVDKWRNRQMSDWKVDRQTNGRKGEWTKRNTEINENGQTGKWRERRIDTEKNGKKGEQTERQMERKVNGQIERWK